MENEGILNKTMVGNLGGESIPELSLTIDGWKYFKKQNYTRGESLKIFMAMKYVNEENPLFLMVERAYRLAAKATGFNLTILTDKPKAGLIDDRLRVEIRTSSLVIADLSYENNGAYWEAGMAEGLGIPVIYSCEKSVFDNEETKPHFDTNHYSTLIWENDKFSEAKEKLIIMIRATLPEKAKMI